MPQRPPNLWSEGAWSDYRGYPRAVTLHDRRLIFAGSPSEPQKTWGSVIVDFRNFDTGTLQRRRLCFFQLAATEANPILWLVSKEGILAGTQGEVWSLSADGTITPSNVNVNLQSARPVRAYPGSTNRVGNPTCGTWPEQISASSFSTSLHSLINPRSSLS